VIRIKYLKRLNTSIRANCLVQFRGLQLEKRP